MEIESDIIEFTNHINELLPINDSLKAYALIKVIAAQACKKTLRFDVTKLEEDLQGYISEEYKKTLRKFFDDLRTNKANLYTSPPKFNGNKIRKDKELIALKAKRDAARKVNEELIRKKRMQALDSLIEKDFKYAVPESNPVKKPIIHLIQITTWGHDPFTPPPMEE